MPTRPPRLLSALASVFQKHLDLRPMRNEPVDRHSTADGCARGAFNGYGTVILRLPRHYGKFNLRTTANLGFSSC